VANELREEAANGLSGGVTAAERNWYRCREDADEEEQEDAGFEEVSDLGDDDSHPEEDAQMYVSKRSRRIDGFMYTIALHKPSADTNLGLEFDGRLLCGGLSVLKVGEGPVREHNQASDSTHRVSPADILVEVNGITGHAHNLLQACLSSPELFMKFQRPETIYVRIPAPLDDMECRSNEGRVVSLTTDLKLGIVVQSTDLPIWTVVEVRDGLVRSAAKALPHDAQVLPGDRVVEVSGISGDTLSMQKALKELPLDIVIRKGVRDLRAFNTSQ
jgi:hypothetical protein